RLDVALVVESGPSMQVWADTFDELERLLGQVGAFRTVTRWELVAGPGEIRLRDAQGAEVSAARLIDPSGSRRVLLATDAVDEAWYRPALWQAVASWARLMPTALVQVLPPHYWPDTAIGDPVVAGRARAPVVPNALLDLESAWWAEPPPPGAVML